LCSWWLINEEPIYHFEINGLAITNMWFKKPKKDGTSGKQQKTETDISWTIYLQNGDSEAV
jgi:hypothetical protein